MILKNTHFFSFQELLEKVRPCIQKKTTNMRKPISAEEKLALTLRLIATGENFSSLSFLFRIHDSTISAFVPIVCWYIYQVLKEEYCKVPASEASGGFKGWPPGPRPRASRHQRHVGASHFKAKNIFFVGFNFFSI